MDIELFIDRFVDAIDDEGDEKITPDTRLDSLENWNSLAALSTVAMVSSDYGVEMPGKVLKSSETVGDIIAFVTKAADAPAA